jgi:hypothetical protein
MVNEILTGMKKAPGRALPRAYPVEREGIIST